MTLAALVVISVAAFVGCSKPDSIVVSTQNLWYGLEAGTQTIEITSNCKWTVIRNDNADWYSITPMNGKNDGSVTVTVQPMENADYRGSSFVISSPGGHVRRTVFVSQNKLHFDGMVNKVFGVMCVEHWNTDYFGQIIEDSYKIKEFNPYDTTTGYLMYFREDGKGLQRDHHNDTAVYYAFDYEYDPVNQILHIEFETTTDSPESYSPTVLTASDSLYRFIHEYKPNFWERADMRKVGIIQSDDNVFQKRAAKKRKETGGVFQIE